MTLALLMFRVWAAGAQSPPSIAPRPMAVAARWSAANGVTDTARTPHRAPIAAAAMGVVFPGLGHVYASEPKRGLVVAGVNLLGGVAVLGSNSKTVNGAGVAAVLGSYVFGIADGAFAATRYNRRHAPRK